MFALSVKRPGAFPVSPDAQPGGLKGGAGVSGRSCSWACQPSIPEQPPGACVPAGDPRAERPPPPSQERVSIPDCFWGTDLLYLAIGMSLQATLGGMECKTP